jgi:hypothetical protein
MWKPGVKDSAMDRQLSNFIACAEEKRKVSLDRRKESTVDRRADTRPFENPLGA